MGVGLTACACSAVPCCVLLLCRTCCARTRLLPCFPAAFNARAPSRSSPCARSTETAHVWQGLMRTVGGWVGGCGLGGRVGGRVGGWVGAVWMCMAGPGVTW